MTLNYQIDSSIAMFYVIQRFTSSMVLLSFGMQVIKNTEKAGLIDGSLNFIAEK